MKKQLWMYTWQNSDSAGVGVWCSSLPNSMDLDPLHYCIWDEFIKAINWKRATSERIIIRELKYAVKEFRKNAVFESCASWSDRLCRMSQNNGDYLRERKYIRFVENLTRKLSIEKYFLRWILDEKCAKYWEVYSFWPTRYFYRYYSFSSLIFYNVSFSHFIFSWSCMTILHIFPFNTSVWIVDWVRILRDSPFEKKVIHFNCHKKWAIGNFEILVGQKIRVNIILFWNSVLFIFYLNFGVKFSKNFVKGIPVISLRMSIIYPSEHEKKSKNAEMAQDQALWPSQCFFPNILISFCCPRKMLLRRIKLRRWLIE